MTTKSRTLSARSPLAAALVLVAASVAAQDFSAQFETIKREATPEQLYRFLYAVPKGGDLHNHLGGAAFDDVLFQLATDPTVNGAQTFRTRVRINNCAGGCDTPLIYFHTIGDSTWNDLPECCRQEYEPLIELDEAQRSEWLSSTRIDRELEGRNEFFEVIWPRIDEVLNQSTVLAELAVANMERFGEEGVRYIEFQLGPWNRRHGDEPLTDDGFHEILQARLAEPDAVATGVTVRFQTNVLRFADDAEERVEQSFAFVDRHRDLWVSVNLVGREDNDKGYPLRFLETFRKMRRRYPAIGLAIHGGEVDEPNEHVRDTLLLGANRIGHGTNLITDPDTLLLMRTGKFAIEISLVSNQLLDYAESTELHPFPEYLRLGIPVTLATDDRGMWDSNMTDEYFHAVTAFNLSWDELVQVGRTSLEFAFLARTEKARLVEGYDRDIAQFEADFLGHDWRAKARAVPARLSGYARRNLLP
jgi:adenosine deaminase CECR1